MVTLCRNVALAGVVSTVSCIVGLAGCGGGEAPQFDLLSDQQVAVGTELVISLVGSDPDGDSLSYSFSADVPEIRSRASISRRPDGSGLFRWTPLAADVGTWFFDFTVSDGSHSETVTIQIDVKSAVGVNSAPVFREPLGTGTTLDLSVASCIDLQIVVEDQDSASVVIAQDEPLIEGATMSSTGGLGATWRWCPSEAQIDAQDRYTLTISADDLTNPKTIKRYLIVLRRPPKPNCPGEPPVITHTPQNERSLVALTIAASVSDDQGLKAAPLFYYSDRAPADPPDLGAMTQLTMVLLSGDMQAGTWAADVPNPVASGNSGDTADIYYVMVAQDNDDAAGDCDHITQSPESSSYSMTVTNPGGTGGAGVCEACTVDVQCGGSNDLCVRVGTGGDAFCLQICAGPSDCPANYSCSEAPVNSVEGAMGRQCVPNSNDCADPGGTLCNDDSLEDNDSRAAAASGDGLPPGNYNLVSCPIDGTTFDEDWFELAITADADVVVSIAGGTQSDLDLQLVDDTGAPIDSSSGITSSESVSGCLVPGFYYVRVHGYGTPVENAYSLTFAETATTCAPVCSDDGAEDDDNAAQARQLGFTDIYTGTSGNGPFLSDTNAICSGDDDWFGVGLVDGDSLSISLTFEQTKSSEDLDIHIYDVAGVDLTPCSSAMPTECTPARGQSASSNESTTFTLRDASCTVSANCAHYVVVRGYNGAANLYDISIGLTIGN